MTKDYLEALKCLQTARETYYTEELSYEDDEIVYKNLNIVEQALLKAQEQEKVLEIIKKKRVNVNQLLLCWKVEMYNSRCRKGYELSKEEFDLLKRWIDNGLSNDES